MKSQLMFIPFFMLFYREIQRFMKVPAQSLLTPVISSSLYILIFGLSLNIDLPNGGSYLAFLIPGLVIMGCLNNAFENSSGSLIGSKFSGELEEYRVAPLSHQQFIWALSFGGIIRGSLVALITFIVGQLFYYSHNAEFLSLADPFILLFFLVVGGLSFAKLGLSATILAKTVDHVMAIGNFILMPLIYLGGVFFPLQKLPEFWQQVSKFNPLLYFVNGVRYGILGESDTPLWLSIIVSVITLVVCHAVALYSTKRTRVLRW